ncbi:hypothetical protein FYJ74_03935 [Pyramidobacter sp. SM-530-WT-4B]|uniref:DUF3352 domain-containing protein n=1 Tax=Pyramidobacter porci TaxID=2605789 RepID=A0A6L5YCC7_9BACT|nr:hypothetical protein [Pyramidobacter porci]MST55192.1 hypothetical protein [Pyramidobacter porci]
MSFLSYRTTPLFLAAALWAVPAEAVTTAQLVSPFFKEESRLSMSCENVKALFNDGARPLEQIFSKAAAAAMELDEDPDFRELVLHAGSAEGRWRYDVGARSVGTGVFAVELDDGFQLPFGSATFPLHLSAAPPGTTLETLAVAGSEESPVYIALLRRGGQRFIVGASDDSTLLEAMAAVPDTEPLEPKHAPAPIGFAFFLPQSQLPLLFGQRALPDKFLKAPFAFEVGISDTERSLRARLWSNASEIVAFEAAKGSADTHPGYALPPVQEKPLLVGGGPLLALLSVEKLLPSEDALDSSLRQKLLPALEKFGLTMSDLAEVLRGRITVAVAGRSSGLLGSYPGFYLHLSGANQRVCELLLGLLQKQAESRASVKTEPFAQGQWQGLRLSNNLLFSGYAASSPRGFIAAFQNSAELERTPSPADDIRNALAKPGYFAFSLDFPALRTELKKLIDRFGPPSADAERRRAAEATVDALDAFGVFNITVTGPDGADAELFVREPQFGRLLDQKMREERRAPADGEKPAGPDAAPEQRQEEASGPGAGIRARAKRQFQQVVGSAAAESPLRVRRGRRETVMIFSTKKISPLRDGVNFCA